ncbi:UNVERIFIED_CONTAM: hypothetical protein Sradi_3645800 [Sesamum radiatum]|uniref:Transposase n=1 Tax=Sesamum radiatum TaxID=300843 RepID=A0AAW2QI38_SESRA
MTRNAFGRLCQLLEFFGGLRATRHVTVMEQVATFLSIIAHHKKNCVVKHDFVRSGRTISKHFHSVLMAVLRLHPILLPRPAPIQECCQDHRWRWFKGCLGALDGTHVNTRVPEVDKGRYRNRKGQISINVLGVCSTEGKFTYVLSGWEGSAADSRETIYLCDNGYSNSEGFLTPYRGVRYHLRDWDRGTGGPQNKEELFNLRHSSAHNVIKRTFDLMKIRWGILRSPSYYKPRTHNRIIMACCLLHNFLRMEMSDDPTVNETQMNLNEQEGSSNPRRYRGKADRISTRRTWSQREEEFLINAFRTIITTGWKCDNGFRSGYLNQLETIMCKHFPNTDLRAEPHINSKIHVWKKYYSSLMGMMSKSGFGWDKSRHMVTVENNDVWDEYLKVDPSVRTMRFKSWPFFNAWREIFGKDGAQGEVAEDINDTVRAVPPLFPSC